MELRLNQLFDMHETSANSNATVAVAATDFQSHKPMFHLWLRVSVGILLVICILTLMTCFSLAFAGGWVGRYATTVETLGFLSFLGCVVFGLASLFLFRDIVFKKGRSDDK